jgi:hypothetical protein
MFRQYNGWVWAAGFNIQGIHKRMVQFQKWINNLCLTLHGHNIHRQRRQLSKFLMHYQQFASHAYCPRNSWSDNACTAGHYSGHATPCLGWVWLPCGCVSCDPWCTHWRIVITKWETWTVSDADGVCCARVRWEINFLFTLKPRHSFVYALYISNSTVHFVGLSFVNWLSPVHGMNSINYMTSVIIYIYK